MNHLLPINTILRIKEQIIKKWKFYLSLALKLIQLRSFKLKLILTLTHVCTGKSLFGSAEAQLSAHHAGWDPVPPVVNHGSPLSLTENLNSSFSQTWSCLQTHWQLWEGKKDWQGYILSTRVWTTTDIWGAPVGYMSSPIMGFQSKKSKIITPYQIIYIPNVLFENQYFSLKLF